MLLDTIMPRGSMLRKRAAAAARLIRPSAPAHLKVKQKDISPAAMAAFGEFVKSSLHPEWYWATDSGRVDYEAHTRGRLADFRATYIPWLQRTAPLAGLRILEIGCGTGPSTLALAEQGAQVTAVDLDAPSVAIAQRRLELYGQQARFVVGDAAKVHADLPVESFDLVVFFATLEHMTHEERLTALSSYWQRLRPGALLAVVDTPNRLWYFDVHTSNLNFFHWLPDEIAWRYTARCSHAQVKELHAKADGMLGLQRWGRGISYHEFDLAIGDVRKLDIVASFWPYIRRRNPARMAKWWLSADRRYNRLLRAVAPDVPAPFMEPYLDFIIRR